MCLCVCSNYVLICVLRRLYTRGGVCVSGDVCVRQMRVTIWAMVCVPLVRMPHPQPHHRSRCHGSHRRHGGNRMRPGSHGQRPRGQRGHEGNVIRWTAQGEGVVGRAGEAHRVQGAVDVLRVQTVQGIQRVQSVMVVSVVPLVCWCYITLQLLHLKVFMVGKQHNYKFATYSKFCTKNSKNTNVTVQLRTYVNILSYTVSRPHACLVACGCWNIFLDRPCCLDFRNEF